MVFLLKVVLAAAPGVLQIGPQNAFELDELAQHTDVTVLELSCLETLEALPASLGKLSALRELKIDNGNGCVMNPQLPDSIGELKKLERLTLNGAQEPNGPRKSPRRTFPASMSKLKQLVYLDLSRNSLEEVPPFVKDLPKLEELRLAFNELRELPPWLEKLPRLKKLVVGNNCALLKGKVKVNALFKRFPKVEVDITTAYECPSE